MMLSLENSINKLSRFLKIATTKTICAYDWSGDKVTRGGAQTKPIAKNSIRSEKNLILGILIPYK